MNCKVMGIVNVTPDSFSDGGKYFKAEEAVKRVKNMLEEGADIIDLGGESTRPGASPISWEEEWSRLQPVLAEVKGLAPISIDTYHPETAVLALKAGANIINCVYEESVLSMLAALSQFPQAELIMPAKSFKLVDTNGPFSEHRKRVIIDPMIGFGTTRDEDLALLKSLPELATKARVLIGASRKRIVKKLTGEKVTGKNLGGNLAIAVWSAQKGASIVRVHDVRETVQALRVLEALG